MDSSGIIRSFNPAATKLFGYGRDEAVGSAVSMLIPEAYRSRHAAHLARNLADADFEAVSNGREVEGLAKDGTTFPMHISIGVMEAAGERMFVGIVTDLTERRKIEEELRTAKASAEGATRSMATFIAHMSHEIRTPVNGIIGFAEVVSQDTQLSPRTSGHVQVIHSAANALMVIINDILDLSKLESGQFEMEAVVFNLPEMLADAMRLFENSAAAKSLDIATEYAAEVPVMVTGDPMRLRQVIVNLVGNAIKFTESGGVILSVNRGDHPGMLHFAVADTGIGMTVEQMSKVFKPFSQADASMSRRFGGTGLGTTISKQIVALMGGDIRVESEFGKGSVFHFTARMPDAADDMERRHNEGRSTGYVSPRKFRVLLAEDNDTNAASVMLRLGDQGHRVDRVRNGRQCVAAFLRGSHDLILMDIMMPELDGLEATREIRRLEEGKRRIPILALTASILRESNERCRAAGMDAVRTKPVDFDALLADMERVVPAEGGRHRIARPVGSEPCRDGGAMTCKPFDPKVVVELLRDMPAALEQLTPDAVEPILDKLAEYLPMVDLIPIRECLDAFDFDVANAEVCVLMARLGLDGESPPC